MKNSQTKKKLLIQYLVVMQDLCDNSCTYWVEWAETGARAKQAAWHKRLDENDISREDREDCYTMDGGVHGYVPILALEKEWVDKIFADAN